MPIHRSPMRIYLGKQYYRFKRYIYWLTDDKRYAAQRDSTLLPHVIFTHQTPLLRKQHSLIGAPLEINVFPDFNRIQQFRKVYAADGEFIVDEFITENHALMMYEPMLADKSNVPS